MLFFFVYILCSKSDDETSKIHKLSFECWLICRGMWHNVCIVFVGCIYDYRCLSGNVTLNTHTHTYTTNAFRVCANLNSRKTRATNAKTKETSFNDNQSNRCFISRLGSPALQRTSKQKFVRLLLSSDGCGFRLVSVVFLLLYCFSYREWCSGFVENLKLHDPAMAVNAMHSNFSRLEYKSIVV